MTVETSGNQVDYTGDAVTEDFVFNYKAYDVDSILVYEDTVITTATVTVTLNSDQDTTPGGSVNVVPAPAVGVAVAVVRIEPLTQLTDYITGGPFPANAHERALDKLTFIVQQIQNVVGGGLGGGGTPSSVSPGAMLFAGALFWEETLLSEMTWDDANKRLGVNVAAVLEKFHLQDGNMLLTPGTNSVQGQPPIKGSLTDGIQLSQLNSVFVFGNYAYVSAKNDDAMRIIDISDSTTPVIVGGVKDAINLNGISDVVCDGAFAYACTSTNNSLQVIDISNPTTPVIVGGLQDNVNLWGVQRVCLSGQYIYINATSNNAVTIIDISTPAAPTLTGTISDAVNLNGIRDIYVAGQYVYAVSQNDNSIRVIDVSDPTTPVIVGGLQDNANILNPHGIFVVGKYAYIVTGDGATRDGSIEIIDVSDPTTPVRVGGATITTNALDRIFKVAVAGDYAYAVNFDGDELIIVDISDPTAPVVVGTRSDNTLLNGLQDVFVRGKYVYLASFSGNTLSIIDISGINAPSASIGSLATTLLDVVSNAIIGNNLVVGGRLNVGQDLHVSGKISASGTIGKTQTVLKSADETITSSVTLQDDDELFVTLEANSVYDFRAMVIVVSNIAPDFKYLWNEADGSFDLVQTLWETGATVSQASINEASAALAVIVTGTTENFISITGTIRTGSAGGVFQLQWAQNTSDAANTTVKADSYIKLTKLK